MGNYIYGYITPLGKSNQSVEDIKTEVVEATKETVDTTEANTAEETVEETVEEINEKSIHPYLIEYGTVMCDSIMINNTAYKCKNTKNKCKN